MRDERDRRGGAVKVLVVGDVVGKPGRQALAGSMERLRETFHVALCIVNGENAAGGAGITPAVVDELFAAGAGAVTTGDHVWDQREIYPRLAEEPRLLRPANYPGDAPGRGSVVVEARGGAKIGVLNLAGRVFMGAAECPFRTADAEIARLHRQTRCVFVDFHAEATSEKIALGRYLDGRATAVVGTHTHVQTADETILPGGTAYITDVGMCGPHDSVLGREVDPVVRRFVTGMPQRFPVARGDVVLCGVVVEFDEMTGRAGAVERVRWPVESA